MNHSRERERLPRRGGGYTTAARLAVDGVGTEVDDRWALQFAGDADCKRARQQRDAVDHIGRALGKLITDIEHIRQLLTADIATPAARNRARRIAHDLAALTRELPS